MIQTGNTRTDLSHTWWNARRKNMQCPHFRCRRSFGSVGGRKPDLAICGTRFEEMAERLAGYDIPVLVLQETMADAVAEPVTYGSVPESRGIYRYQSMEVILHEVQVMTLTENRQQKDGECRNGNGGNWCLLSDLS